MYMHIVIFLKLELVYILKTKQNCITYYLKRFEQKKL